MIAKRFLRKVPGNVAESTLGASSILLSFLLGTAILALIFVYGQTTIEVYGAADQGVRVAAANSDLTQIDAAITGTLSAENLPATWNGSPTYNESTTQITTGAGVPMDTLTIHYNAPNLFPNLPSAFGLGVGENVPITVTAAAVNSEYFAEGGS